MVLVIIAVLIGAFVWWRTRKGKLGLPISRGDIGVEGDESIPLRTNGDMHDDPEDDESRLSKGKGRATSLTPHEEIFGVGEDEDEDPKSPRL